MARASSTMSTVCWCPESWRTRGWRESIWKSSAAFISHSTLKGEFLLLHSHSLFFSIHGFLWYICFLSKTETCSILDCGFQIISKISGLYQAEPEDFYWFGQERGRVRDLATGGTHLLPHPGGRASWHVPAGEEQGIFDSVNGEVVTFFLFCKDTGFITINWYTSSNKNNFLTITNITNSILMLDIKRNTDWN